MRGDEYTPVPPPRDWTTPTLCHLLLQPGADFQVGLGGWAETQRHTYTHTHPHTHKTSMVTDVQDTLPGCEIESGRNTYQTPSHSYSCGAYQQQTVCVCVTANRSCLP